MPITIAVEGFELRGFSSTLALEALAELGPELESLSQGGARGRVRTSALGAQPLLFIPEEAALRDDGEPHKAYRQLLDVFARRAPHFERQNQPLTGAGWWRLDQALALFLLESGHDDEAAEAEDGELLLIDRRGNAEAAVKLCGDLRFHATHCRMATATVSGGGNCFLVHVLADPERKPSLAGLDASGALAGLDRLAAFHAGERTVFLGGGRAPSERALVAFCDLLASLAPALATAERLLAIVPRDTDAGIRLEIYPLAGLDFMDQAAFTPRASPYAEVEVLSLAQSATEMQHLRRRILEARPRIGHHLELRRGFPTEGFDRELEHVVAELAELEQRRAYLESLRRPRPVLMRYTQHQLAALADAIRCFPSLEVRDGKVLYGFHATDENPAGWHYLFFHPGEAVQSEPYPPWRWSDLEERLDDVGAVQNETLRFWVDPLWAEDYHESGESLVFVPRGSVLFPTLHSWRPAQMDAYLRELLRQWFPDERQLTGLPKRALYLFDEVRGRTSGQQEIRIQVLDQEGFAPLAEQISWFNDNLSLQHALGGVEELVRHLAERESHRRLAATFAREARQAEATFELAAHTANEKMAEGAAELLDVMTEEIAKIAERCRLATEEIPRMHALLEETAATLERLKTTRSRSGDALAATTRAIGENLQWVRALDEELTRLESESEHVETQAGKAIDDLRRRYDDLVRRIG